MEASQQAQVDQDTAAIAQIGTDLAAGVATVQAELDQLKSDIDAGQPADLSKLEAAIATVDAQAKAVANLAPTPAPAARSVYTIDPGNTADGNVWPTAPLLTTDTPPQQLYYYSGDTAPGDKNGDGLGGIWHLYTGPTQGGTAS